MAVICSNGLIDHDAPHDAKNYHTDCQAAFSVVYHHPAPDPFIGLILLEEAEVY
jgi:hypothetical protein